MIFIQHRLEKVCAPGLFLNIKWWVIRSMIFSSSSLIFFSSLASTELSMAQTRWSLDDPNQGSAFHEIVVLPTLAPHLARPYIVPGTGANDGTLFFSCSFLCLLF